MEVMTDTPTLSPIGKYHFENLCVFHPKTPSYANFYTSITSITLSKK